MTPAAPDEVPTVSVYVGRELVGRIFDRRDQCVATDSESPVDRPLGNLEGNFDCLPGSAPRAPRRPREQGTAPCLVALWTDVVAAKPKAIHRTALTMTAEKIDRMSLGPSAGCVIRLWEHAAVERGLVIGEGIETTLAAATGVLHQGASLTPAWACGCSGNLRDFSILSGIEALTILIDHDESDAGQCAAEACARWWRQASKEVVRLTPRTPGTDFNNIVDEAGL